MKPSERFLVLDKDKTDALLSKRGERSATARRLGFALSHFSDMLKGRRGMPESKIGEFCRLAHTTENAILTRESKELLKNLTIGT